VLRDRRARAAGAFAAVVVLGGASAAAADPGDRDSARDVYELHLAIDIPVMVVGGSVGLTRALFEDQLARKSCPCDASSVNALDRWAIGYHSDAANLAANITVYGTMAALPVLDALDLGFGRPLLHDVVVYAEALAVDTGLQNIVNFAVARPRPRTYAGDPAFVNGAEGYVSFYAGHVATAFTAMSVASFTLRRRYGAGIWPWIATALVGGSVAFERVASGHHFPTDVATAAVAGTAIGIAIPWAHTRPSDAISLAPAPAGQGLALVGRF
jgi:membrane-associated phospholipid phosphatase